MLGRFCHGDELLERHVSEHLKAEESLQPEAIFAEVVHLRLDDADGNRRRFRPDDGDEASGDQLVQNLGLGAGLGGHGRF